MIESRRGGGGGTKAAENSPSIPRPRIDVSSITMLAFEFPPCDGGISRLCGAAAAGFMAAGTTTRLITDARYSPHVQQELDAVIGTGPGRGIREFSALKQLRALSDPGLIVCGTWYPEGLLALISGRGPYVVLAHGAELMPTTSVWRRRIWKLLLRKVCTTAELVIANSDYTRRLVGEAAPEASVATIPLGVDPLHFDATGRAEARGKYELPNQLIISSVSRLTEYKGHGTVFRALAALPPFVREKLIYLVAGKGPYEEELRREADQLGVGASVRWLGFMPEQELPDLYRASDLFVLCTRETMARPAVEGFGLVFLEAQACGTAVVGVRSGGIPDAICEGDGGWLIEQDDSGALASLFAALAADPKPFHAMGRAARRRVERECTWSHYMQRLGQAFAANGIQIA